MLNKTHNLRLSILVGCCLTLVFCLNNFSQPTSDSNEKRKIKNFGSSLKKFGKKEKDNKNNDDSTNDETIRVETNLVMNDVLVLNQKGNVIAGLKQSDFIVTEDEKLQEIGIFAFGENSTIPRSIVLIIENGGIPSFVEQSAEAAKKMIDKLNPQDKMAIAADNLKLLCNFTGDKNLLKSTLDKVIKQKKGSSMMEYSTLLAVLNEMFDEKDIRPTVILQSSGDEFVVLKPTWDVYRRYCKNGTTHYCERDFSFSDVKKTIENSRATIYSIIPEPRVIGLSKTEQLEKVSSFLETMSKEVHHRKNPKAISDFVKDWEDVTLRESLAMQTSLFEIANLSGGYTDYIEKPEDAESVYSTLFMTINNRYVIGYYSTNQEKDGKSRAIKIEVKNHPEYKILGRKTYIPEN